MNPCRIRSLILAAAVMCAVAVTGCGSDSGDGGDWDVAADARDATGEEAGQPATGTFSVLTYNVAGLPEGISGSQPEVYMVQISPLLNGYDLALVQEDFWYHQDLVSQVDHSFQSDPWNIELDWTDMGDGLNRFSPWPFEGFERIPWPGCYGGFDCASDCFATKGFSVARHHLAEGVEVDVYNLHMEAGHCPGDIEIRADSVQLLLDVLAERSVGVPVVMAGDFNLHETKPVDMEQLERLVLEGGLADACWTLQCGNASIDRVFFRDSADIELSVEFWGIPPEFVDDEGEDLSDHRPTSAVLTWLKI